MTDYISRADAIEALSRSSVYAWSTEQDLVAHNWAIRILQSLPSADAISREDYEDIIKDYRKQYENMNNEIADLEAKLSAEPNCKTCAIKELWKETEKEDLVSVVRCKDCRHGWYDDDIEYYTCRHPKGLNEELYGVDFCSYGERKEE